MNPEIPKIEIIGQSTLVDEASLKNNPRFHTFPSLTRLGNGDYLCSTLIGATKSGPEGRIRSFRSVDGCASWKSVMNPSIHDEEADTRYGYICCHLTELSNGNIVAAYLRVQRSNPKEALFHPKTDGIQRCEVRLVFSRDRGESWSMPKALDYTVPDVIVNGKCVDLGDGTIGLPCEIWHEWESGFREGPSARLILSTDSGNTWSSAAIMAADADKQTIFGDPRITICGKNRLYAMFWRYSLKTGSDLNTHATISEDGGRNWGPAFDTGIKGQISNPLWLGSGFMACVFQDRFEQPGLRVAFSRDSGLTWNTAAAPSIWNAGTGSGTVDKNPFQGYQTYSFGYSSVIRAENGDFVICFWNGDNSATNISFIRFRIILP